MSSLKGGRGRRPAVLIRQTRLVAVTSRPPLQPVDLRLRDGRICHVGAKLRATPDDIVLAADGRWASPGLWDQHVHLGLWAQTLVRLDLSGTADPGQVTDRVRDHLSDQGRHGTLLTGFGFRSGTWQRRPTVAELDAVSGDHPVVLISGDAHNGWLNSRALALLGVPPRTGPLEESEWFEAFARLNRLPPALDSEDAYPTAVSAAAGKGVVGIVDMEFAANCQDWPDRLSQGVDALRVRVAAYPDRLAEVLAAGLRSGQQLPGGAGLLTMGPLKIISDGSLNSRTAYCHQPYADAATLAYPHGRQNYAPAQLTDLLRRARAGGLECAVHAIGDAAAGNALDAFAATGATGTIEHAQLMTAPDIARLGRLPVEASVQPAHLLDDRQISQQCWPDRTGQCFALRDMLSAGVRLRLGSDAPVAALDPWLAMAAAVHRSGTENDPWHPEQSLSAVEALAASTDGQGTLTVGSRADLLLLDDDPLRSVGNSWETAQHLREMTVAATFLAGRPTHLAL